MFEKNFFLKINDLSFKLESQKKNQIKPECKTKKIHIQTKNNTNFKKTKKQNNKAKSEFLRKKYKNGIFGNVVRERERGEICGGGERGAGD